MQINAQVRAREVYPEQLGLAVKVLRSSSVDHAPTAIVAKIGLARLREATRDELEKLVEAARDEIAKGV